MDRTKKCSVLPSFLNRPPVSPKPFTMAPPPTLPASSGSCELGWHQMQPYFTNHGEAGGSVTKPRLESFEGTNHLPLLDNTVLDDKHLLVRYPIKPVTSWFDNQGGITAKTELGIDYEMKWRRNMDHNMDDRKFRRILSNRISAQKSRMRKLHYVNDLEKKKNDLQLEVAMLAPLIESEQEEQKRLQMENHFLKERMSVCEERAKLSIVVLEENRSVVRRLKEMYAEQQNIYYVQLEEEPIRSLRNNHWNTTTRVNQQVMGDSISISNEGTEAKPIVEDQPLNFNSLTIYPPNSLM